MTDDDHDNNDDQVKALAKKSKKLSWLLRHGANEAGLAMSAAGFARIDDVLAIVALSRAELDVVVAENNKARYELSDDGVCVRACQGHSMAGTPVTREGLEATWTIVEGDDDVVHGTSVAAARLIVREGLLAMERTHVHLAPSATSVVGKRANVDVLLIVSPPKLRAAGFPVFRARNGVLLARAVPKAAIVGVTGENRPGRAAVDELRGLL